ncbi:MAG: Gfo/Idh/MocA family oxidoreductase [Ruminococcaceae bacterium]|nr:Gfo/Idh/MocA family oxidoreductase [Oscillospiraceae bacterium]
MNKKLTAIIIGAGSRGRSISRHMKDLPEQYEVVAVAEPIDNRRNALKEKFNIPDERCFTDWKPLLALGKIADVAVIATMDKDHFEPAMAAISQHYDILLEKPVSPDPIECEKIACAAEKEGVKILICHVLRYTPFYGTVKKLITDGVIGDVISVNHEENVGNEHQSHSFVRGNWGNEGRASFMLLQKSCHDIDILQWLVGKKCKKVQSFGSLRYFRRENAPEGAPERCIDGCPHGESCPYNTEKLYIQRGHGWFRDAAAKKVAPTDEEVMEALRTTQYGKCVFKCDNDVVDHQTVNMLFEDDVTVNFTMCAFNKGGRYTHIMGTKGELWAALNDEEKPIRVYNFETREETEYPYTGKEGLVDGHAGGDMGMVVALYELLNGTYKGNALSDIRTSVNNHHIVFAAEQARKTGAIIDMDAYIASLEHL